MIAVCVAVTGMYAVTTWHARDVAVESARRESVNLAGSLAHQVADTVEIAEGALTEIVARVEMEGTSPESRVLLSEDMAQEIVAMPRLHMLLIVDARGRLLLDATSSGSRQDLDFRPREYFGYHRASATRAAFVSGPVHSETDGTWVMTVTRRIDRSNGTFAGIAVAEIGLDDLVQTYAGMDIGPSGVIALMRANGTMLVRQPAQRGATGRQVNTSLLLRAPLRDLTSGTYVTRSPLDGVERLYAFQRSERDQLVLIVGLAERDFLTHWRADAAGNGAVTIVIVIAIAGLGAFLIAQIEKRQLAEDSLSRLALLDGLTGIANRRQLDVIFEREWQRAAGEKKALAALMIDVDHFKTFNDRYGHAQGDDALRCVAETIAGNVRPTDFVARYGGEEFVVVLPATDREQAAGIAERIRLALVDRKIPHAGAADGTVTVSIGVGSLTPNAAETRSSLIDIADAALYEAKRRGRNRSVIGGDERPAFIPA